MGCIPFLVRLVFLIIVSSTVLISVNSNEPTGQTDLINRDSCDPTPRSTLVVSLMNGDVKALDLNTGACLWGVHTGSKLLSSSITTLEVIYNGIPTRLVPSLDGSLFRFQDDGFEPLPFTAETLLSSSFKLPGDLTIVGSKESRTVGLDPSCGQVYYKCDKEGCESTEQHNLHEKDVLVVKHLAHTVRSASLRDGEEKWNFSVGHHELTFSEAVNPTHTSGPQPQCGEESCDKPAVHNVKFSVPDGVVIRLNEKQELLWKRQLEAPISKSWVLINGNLGYIDLLDPKYLMLGERISNDGSGSDTNTPPPSLYIGVYEQQVYLQPSKKLLSNLSAASHLYQRGNKLLRALPKVRWAPYLTTSPSRTPWLNYGKADPTQAPPTTQPSSALSVFNPTLDYPYDQGFYLNAEVSSAKNSPRLVEEVNVSEEDTVFEEIEKQIVWLYSWKEVVLISILSAVALNGVLYITRNPRRRLKAKCFGSKADLSEVSDVSEVSNSNGESKVKETEEVVRAPPPQYHSRYQSDFTHVQCLGRGGFGVVFCARNTTDEHEYAVKRISLHNSIEAREKVVREVKALARLDHPGIVRYYQSWFETPPPGWQEDQDKIWESTERLLPTPVNSACALISPQTTAALPLDNEFFIPKLRLDETGDSDASLGFPVNNRIDESVDIVFASGSGEISVPAHQPFHKYAVAPADDSDHNDSSVDREHQDDSGYHKNSFMLVGTSEPFTNDDDNEDDSKSSTSISSATPPPTYSSVKPATETQSKLFLYIQMQLCKKETLREYLNANTLHRDKNKLLLIFRQICDAVEYIHSQGLIHRDLKPTNIFFSKENVIKVGDFGLVTATSDDESDVEFEGSAKQTTNLTNNVGTQLYMSPEQVARRQYNNKVDIYALGMVYFELKYPFSTVMERVLTLQGIKKQKYPERFIRELPLEYKFVKWMLTRNPSSRPTITDVLHSEVMQGSADLLQADRLNRMRTISRSSND